MFEGIEAESKRARQGSKQTAREQLKDRTPFSSQVLRAELLIGRTNCLADVCVIRGGERDAETKHSRFLRQNMTTGQISAKYRMLGWGWCLVPQVTFRPCQTVSELSSLLTFTSHMHKSLWISLYVRIKCACGIVYVCLLWRIHSLLYKAWLGVERQVMIFLQWSHSSYFRS